MNLINDGYGGKREISTARGGASVGMPVYKPAGSLPLKIAD